MKKAMLFFVFIILVRFAYSANVKLKIQQWQPNKGLPETSVLSIDQDEEGFIILHCSDGVYRFNGRTSYLVHDQSLKSAPEEVRLENGRLLIYGDTIEGDFNGLLAIKNQYWLAGSSGLGRVDVPTKTIDWLNKDGELPDTNCLHPVADPDGKIWFSMPLMGVGFYEPDSKKFYSIRNFDEYPNFPGAHEVLSVLLDQDITYLFFDRNGSLWIAAGNDGLYKISFELQRYQFFRFEFDKEAGLAHRDISFPLATHDGDVWISTWGGGINLWAKEELESARPGFKRVPLRIDGDKPFPDMRIFPLMEDSGNNIWIGSRNGGLYMINGQNRKMKNYKFEIFNRANGNLPNDEISSLCEGLNKDIWCGTYSGLVRIDSALNCETSFSELEDPDFFRKTNISMVGISEKKRMWIGARNNKLYLWDFVTDEIDSFQVADPEADGRVFNHAHVNDTDWFVSSKGIFYYDKIENEICFYENNLLLPHVFTESLLADEEGMLWIGSSAGLAKINPVTNEVSTFNLTGGTMGTNFTQGASKDDRGFMYFGSRYGLYRFHPKNMVFEPPATPIVISEIGISGEAISLDSLKKSGIWKINDEGNFYLQLKHQQNTVTLNYLNLDYEKDAERSYEIILRGHDVDWSITSDTHRTWSDLKPGNYTFKVKEKGQKNATGLDFEIRPPWWVTWPAFLAYFLVLTVLILIFYRVTSIRAKEKEKRRQKEKYDQLRFRFFLNISHEIRTPLTLIKGAIDRLFDVEKEVENKELQRIKYNTGRLIRMVNEVLDLKEIERTEMKVRISYFNLKSFLESTADAFRLREDTCNIELDLPESTVWINSGRELLETILYNLLSNALKFSPENGRIKISLTSYESACAISVRDFGVGIPREEQKKIFDRYYKYDENRAHGAGIGLALVKEFVTLLNGKIELESAPDKGSTFIVTLPLEIPESSLKAEKKLSGTNGKVILVVDDHADIRSFISEIFEKTCTCIEAENGKLALELIKETTPELIISDVIMPEMNGFELCNKLKENIETSHIPVILLTAKTDFDTELMATECAADAFVAKPFNERLLRARVEQLIEQRRVLREKFSGLQDHEKTLKFSPIDKEFIRNLENTIEDHLDDSTFGVDDLSATLALSTSGLYRKLKALTDQSPVEFIRNFRLRKAAEALMESNHSITEIADMTGFGTQKYFSRCFKEQFGISPLQYRKKRT